ncbi:MAG: GntR family transcriptional regulator [Kiritimatiellales bacterium]|nr:GntR family transcriptional regulator [Kiritimatiellales bacterium]
MKKNSFKTIHDELLKRIQRGDYRTGELLPTDLQLAAEFGVSRPTIARAFSMLVNDGLVGRKAGYGTFITRVPRSFHWNVGLIIPGLGETEIFEPICSKIAECFDREDVKFHWTSSSGTHASKRETALQLCRSCIEQKLDGVFFTPMEHEEDAETTNRQILRQLNDAHIQTVLLDRDVLPWPQQTPQDLVGIDNIQAGFVVARHLIDAGCKTFLFITAPVPATTVKLRIMGCREALLQSSFSPDSLRILETDISNPGSVADTIRRIQPDALVCANDATAASLMRSLIDKGTAIPEQLQISAFDDVRYASLLSVPLTTYRQPCDEIGTTAAATMLERLKNPSRSPRRISLKGELIVRQSTKEAVQ